MVDRWGRDQVLALAPDASSKKAATGVADPSRWHGTGCDHEALWGGCQGGGTTAYRAAVDLSEPAFRCSCPSRKFPCKHALALLLLWSDGGVGAGAAPGWVREWLTERRERAARTRARRAAAAGGGPGDVRAVEPQAARPATAGSPAPGSSPASPADGSPAGSPKPASPAAAPPAVPPADGSPAAGLPAHAPSAGSASPEAEARRSPAARQREERVGDGLEEFDRWLRDQVAQGLVQAEHAPYQVWDDTARRLVDAQAGALAGRVRALAAIPRQGDGWPARLLEEYALLRLLATAYRRRDELPAPLHATVRSRVGLPVSQEEVLAGERVRDRWFAAGLHDTEQDHLVTRRVWLRGRRTGRSALVLSFAAPGRALDASLVAGTTVDAELAFYPGAQPLRALVTVRHGGPESRPPRGTTVEGMLREHAAALSRDPWLDRWPAVLEGVRPARTGSTGAGAVVTHVVDEHGAALPLRAADPWPLLAVSGGRPLTVCGEWSPRGLLPLSAWQHEEGFVVL